MREPTIGKSKRVHPYQWLWEPLEMDPTFLVRPMFGGKSLYLDGKLMLYFTAGEEPWRGVLVCTERAQHAALMADFSELSPHPILPKWLYLPESAERFESVAERIVALARRRDPRLGVSPKPKKKKKRAKK
jgi:TfoX/Sxy family transcriptional regulator of competence genes